jgi:hypothetical protein
VFKIPYTAVGVEEGQHIVDGEDDKLLQAKGWGDEVMFAFAKPSRMCRVYKCSCNCNQSKPVVESDRVHEIMWYH